VAQEEDELNLRQVLSVVKHRWWLIAGITLGVTGAIALWTFLKTPIYEGRFLLLIGQPIEENKTSQLECRSIPASVGWKNIDYETQIAVLKSPQLLNPILSKVTPEISLTRPNSDLISKTGTSDSKISQLKETKVLEISYQDAEPGKNQPGFKQFG
jgi:uncharacterized protein involved in exopolysaccharide biosynthesis